MNLKEVKMKRVDIVSFSLKLYLLSSTNLTNFGYCLSLLITRAADSPHLIPSHASRCSDRNINFHSPSSFTFSACRYIM